MDEQTQYLASIGQRVLQEMQAEQAAQQAPMDSQTAQRLRNEQILMERNRAAQDRVIEAAQAKERQATADWAKEQMQAQQARAEALDRSLEEQALTDFLARDGKRADFPKYYAAHKFELFDEMTRGQEQELRRKSPAFGAI